MPRGSSRSIWLWGLGIAFGLLIVSEVGLRLLADYHSRWNVRLGASKEFDPIAFFRNKPNYDHGQGLVTNEYGYQAPMNLTRELPTDSLRVLYLGDSNSVVPLRGNYPSQVEEKLEADLGIDVETVNTAVPGHSSQNVRLLFESEISHFDADHFVVYVGWNDLGQFGPEGLPYKRHELGYEISTAQRLLTQVYSARFLYAYRRYKRRSQPAFHGPLSSEDAALYASYEPSHFDENLREILKLAKDRYPNVYMATPSTITNDDPTEGELATAHFPTGMDKNIKKLHVLVMKYDAVVREVARDMDVELLDFHGLFLTREARQHFTDSAHVNKKGAERWARMTSAAIIRREREDPTLPRSRSATATRAH